MDEKAVARVGDMWKRRVREEKARSCSLLRLVSRRVRVLVGGMGEGVVGSGIIAVSAGVFTGVFTGEEGECSVMSRVLDDDRELWAVGIWMFADVVRLVIEEILNRVL